MITALGPDLKPAGGVAVTYAVLSGDATLSCGSGTCATRTTGDGIATINITARSTAISVVTATLANGASLQAHFSGGTPPSLTALTPTLSVAAGSVVNWTTRVLALNNGSPAASQTVAWQPITGASPVGAPTTLTDTYGNAAMQLRVGPLAEGQQITSTACLNGTSQCVNFVVTGARPEYAWLEPVSGIIQSLSASDAPGLIEFRVRDTLGNPMAGATVSLYQATYAWSPPCPPHGRCAQPSLLSSQMATAASAIDGTVSFVPASMPGVPTQSIGLGVAGASSAVTVTIDRHP